MNKVLIESVNEIVPKSGSNAGRTMYVINGKLWSRVMPKDNDTHIITEEVEVDNADPASTEPKRKFTNVVGFSNEIRMSVTDKIALIVKQDAGYSLAIASLLR